MTVFGTTFVSVSEGANAVISSNHGVNWTSHAMPSTGWADVAASGVRIVAVGFDKIAYSTNGTSWTEIALTGDWYAVAWNGSKFCAIAYNSTSYATSSDGISWTVFTDLPITYQPWMPGGMTTLGSTFYALNYNSILVGNLP
jgi:hypothetical protein